MGNKQYKQYKHIPSDEMWAEFKDIQDKDDIRIWGNRWISKLDINEYTSTLKIVCKKHTSLASKYYYTGGNGIIVVFTFANQSGDIIFTPRLTVLKN